MISHLKHREVATVRNFVRLQNLKVKKNIGYRLLEIFFKKTDMEKLKA